VGKGARLRAVPTRCAVRGHAPLRGALLSGAVPSQWPISTATSSRGSGQREFKRSGRGDHEIWWHPETKIRLTVDRKLRSKVTANEILKDAGLPKAF
jgi:hypothetical protein